ncbi:hypothetical protein [Emticicia sp.]|uniref:hypothetical protein n=1 Tax=Emticicia sp. TaxID=1930953 RepID=UPI0037520D1A
MSKTKTLTLHNTNEGNGEHWYSRQNEYGKKEIDGIIDPEGGNTKEPPTSIPSPFARFDLVRTAFAKLSQNETLDGEPNDKRLVSECFDVGQIFFNYDKLKDKVKIIKWDKAIGLESLKNSPLTGHKRFGNALDLFLKQDGGTAKASDDDKRSGGYNFDLMDTVYILRYTDDKDSGIIGGTSPSTIFFSSPNDLSFVDIQFGNDKLFDKDLCPLHKRDVEYQKFWHGFSKQANFMKHFPEVSAYLKRSLDLLKKENNVAWQQIGTDAEKLTSSVYNDLFEDLVSQSGDLVTALEGFRIKKVKVDPAQLAISDFIIPSEKYSRLYPDKLKPMILQNNYQGRLIYSKDYWNKDQPVPSYVADDWRENKRRLPGQQDFYPWLTVSDFLEPNIVRLVYPINNDCFFNGGLSGGNELTKSYLLPLKKDFFDFFDVEDLTIGQGRKVGIKMENLAGESAVKVTLSIPMKVGQPPIVFERVYKDSISGIPLIPDENKRVGGSIVELQFGVNVMPFLRIESEGFNPLYRVQVVDRDIDYLTFSNDYNLKFINKDNQYILTPPPKERSKKKQNVGLAATTKYYSVEKNFDYISVEVGGKKGIILPRFDKVSKEMGSEKFTFAVDFGTTNTHIEYKTVRNTTAMPLEINKEDNPIATLHDPRFLSKDSSFNGTAAAILALIIPVEMIPERINKEEKASFPTRTALLENSPKWSENLFGFMDFNPAFLYEKQNLDDSYNPATNLKWSNYKTDDREEKRVEGYIQSLLILIRNKILLNGGNLEATELVWFYPLSMLETRRNYFEGVWNKHYQRIITSKNYPQRIPESTAPFYWFAHGAGKQTAIAAVYYPAVCVDIGGGTSDVVIFEEDKPVCLTSFRFAANAIFGDAFAQEGAANRNGFVLKYEDKIKQLLKDNGFQDLIRAYEAIRNRQHSEDIIAFFFSLQDNKEIQKKTNLNFNDMLAKDDSLKIIFLIFYTATIYHIAKIMKIKNFKMPRYLAFSGNGSKVLRVLSNKTTVLAQLAKLIFEKVYEMPYHEDDLEVIMDQDSPKEVTCKGGLKRSNSLKFDTPDDGKEDLLIEKIKAVLIGSADDRFGVRSDTYEKIDENTLSSVAEEVRKFIDLLFTLNEDFNFKQKLNVNTSDLDEYKKILLKDLAQNVKIGFSHKKAESDKKDPVEETLFFYPLIKGINNLATEIAK